MNDELVLSVHDAKAVRAVPISLSEVGLREREHLQEWVLEHPAVLGPDTRYGRSRLSPDPDDDYLGALARTQEEVGVIVSGDNDLLTLGLPDVDVLTPRAFLDAAPARH